MSATDWNKFIGAGLMAVLLALGVSFLSELLFAGGGHADDGGHQVAAVSHSTSAPASPDAGAAEEVVAAIEEVASIGVRMAEADAGAGEKAFKKCAVCHSVEQGGPQKVGPNLFGIVGGPKGGVAGFAYSSGLVELGGTWSFDDLDQFLASPKGFVKGTKMAFPGIRKPDQRADVIAYLLGYHDSPPPLPSQ